MRAWVCRCLALLSFLLAASGAGAETVKEKAKAPAKEPAKKAPAPTDLLTQRDFVAMLVPAFGWQGGVPEEPADKDYLAVLGGNRTFRFEAEETYNKKKDNVSIREYGLYGPFSGTGWVSGVAVPTTVHFNVLIPIAGEYTLTIAAKGDGQTWTAGGKAFKVNSGNRLKTDVAGTVKLAAGEQEIVVDLPAEGGIDYFILEASPLMPIEPMDGWRLDEPLTRGKVAEIAASLLGWEKALPDDPAWKTLTIPIAEAAYVPSGATTTTLDYLGKFLGKKWVRAGQQGALIPVPLIIRDGAAYGIKVRYLGETLVAGLDGRKLRKPAKPYLEWVDLGLNRLKAGAHTLILTVEPNGGVDVVTLEKRKSSPDDYMKLVGLDGKPGDTVTRAQAEKYLVSFLERFKERQ